MNKTIYDPIHKYMDFEPLLLEIINTIEFQRLRDIKQLGLCYYVFPGASHNRFEHSLGVSYLSGLLINTLKINQPELNISDRTILLVKIAGLVHDLGHVCFSHAFDKLFLKYEIPNSKYKDHEYRSCKLFEFIINKYKINVTKDEIKIICDMINPNKQNNNFIYEIISNKVNGLDCDKFDYIARDTYNIGLSYSFDPSRLIKEARVINDHIAYSKKCYYEIADLYYTRYKLHKQVYTHNTVRIIEHMIIDIIKELNNDINFIEKIKDCSKISLITDNILDLSYYYNNKKAIKIYENIKLRNLYKFVKEIKRKNFNLNEFKYELNNNNLNENVIIDHIIINFSLKKLNPLEYVTIHDNLNIINKKDLSILYPITFEEEIIKIYIKNLSLYNQILTLVNKFIKK